MRQLLTPEVIRENSACIEAQIRRVLAGGTEPPLVVDNGEWLGSLGYLTFLREIGRHFSVNRMLTADAYRARLEKGLSFIEFNYQILQAYDFLVLHQRYGCQLQVGGDDQWSNMLAGADLIRRCAQVTASALTFPLVTTASGAKMGKTAAGAVWLSPDRTSPFEFFQYFVNVDDRDVGRFLRLFTFLPLAEVGRLEALGGSEARLAKAVLAHEVTKLVHGDESADAARRAAAAAFGTGDASAIDVPTVALSASELEAGVKIVDLLVSSGLSESKSAARRLVAQGGVRLGEQKRASIDESICAGDLPAGGTLLYAGKRQVRRIVAAG